MFEMLVILKTFRKPPTIIPNSYTDKEAQKESIGKS